MNLFPFTAAVRAGLLLWALPVLLSAQNRSASAGPLPPDSLGSRPVLLVFSGSDWCIPCIRLEKEVLSDTVFLAFAKQHLQVVNADFPQRKKGSAEQERRNEALAARYNPEGAFPKLLLLHPDGSIWATLPWKNQDALTFVEQVRNRLQTH